MTKGAPVERQPPSSFSAAEAYPRLSTRRSRARSPARSPARRNSAAALRCSARRSGSSRACWALRRSHSGSGWPGKMTSRPPTVVANSAKRDSIISSISSSLSLVSICNFVHAKMIARREIATRDRVSQRCVTVLASEMRQISAGGRLLSGPSDSWAQDLAKECDGNKKPYRWRYGRSFHRLLRRLQRRSTCPRADLAVRSNEFIVPSVSWISTSTNDCSGELVNWQPAQM